MWFQQGFTSAKLARGDIFKVLVTKRLIKHLDLDLIVCIFLSERRQFLGLPVCFPTHQPLIRS